MSLVVSPYLHQKLEKLLFDPLKSSVKFLVLQEASSGDLVQGRLGASAIFPWPSGVRMNQEKNPSSSRLAQVDYE